MKAQIMNLKLLAILLAFFLSIRTTQAQDAKIDSKAAANAIREFHKTNQRLNREYLDERDELDEKHTAKFEANKSELLAKLQSALESEAKAVDLEAANSINRVLIAQKARDITLPNPLGNRGRNRVPESMLGGWVGKWGTTGNPIELDLSETKDAINGAITFQDNRILLMEKKNEYVELIPYNNKILVLGYSRTKKRHPNSTLPNHIGIVSRRK